MRLPSWKFCAVLLTACACAGVASTPARAGYLSNFTGNTYMGSEITTSGTIVSPNLQGVVSFTVYQNAAGHNWVTDTGLSPVGMADQNPNPGWGAAVDTGAKYVYMYQVYVTKTSNDNVAEQLQVNAGDYTTSAGYFTKTVFKDAQGNVGSSTNTGLGTDPTTFDVPNNGSPSVSGQTAGFNTNFSGTASIAGAVQHAGSSVIVPTRNLLEFTFSPLMNQGKTSVVLFFTSNEAPSYFVSNIHDGDLPWGDIPAPIPEPGTFVLAGMGVVGLVGAYARRRKLTVA